MNTHTYDWAARLSEKAEHCYHLAVQELEEQKGLDGKVVAMLCNCLRCGNTLALNPQYVKTDRFCGDKAIYVRKLYKS